LSLSGARRRGSVCGSRAQHTVGAATAPFKRCSGSFDPQGKAGGGFYRDIRAERVTCTTARSVTKAWVVAHASGSTNPMKKSIVKGYSCTGTGANNVLRIICVRDNGRRAVRFVGSS